MSKRLKKLEKTLDLSWASSWGEYHTWGFRYSDFERLARNFNTLLNYLELEIRENETRIVKKKRLLTRAKKEKK